MLRYETHYKTPEKMWFYNFCMRVVKIKTKTYAEAYNRPYLKVFFGQGDVRYNPSFGKKAEAMLLSKKRKNLFLVSKLVFVLLNCLPQV